MSKSSHMSTFLTVLGVAGVIATSIAAVKATPKAIQIIEEEKKQKVKEDIVNLSPNDNTNVAYRERGSVAEGNEFNASPVEGQVPRWE